MDNYTEEQQTMKPVAIFRHSPGEGPGYFSIFLESNGIPWTLIPVDAGAAIPDDASAYSGLCFMGGPMSVNDDLPWIRPLCSLLRDAISDGTPVIGHCLGGRGHGAAGHAAALHRGAVGITRAELQLVDGAVHELERAIARGELGQRVEAPRVPVAQVIDDERNPVVVGAQPLHRGPLRVADLLREDNDPAALETDLRGLENGQARATLRRLAEAWARADRPTLEDYPRWCRCADTPAARARLQRLLQDRNAAMAARLQALHAEGAQPLVAVGALHLVGPQGLPALLQAAGFTVQALVPAPRPASAGAQSPHSK